VMSHVPRSRLAWWSRSGTEGGSRGLNVRIGVDGGQVERGFRRQQIGREMVVTDRKSRSLLVGNPVSD
jgi:hypothetical protein